MDPIYPIFARMTQALDSQSSSAKSYYTQDTRKAGYDSDAFASTYGKARDMFLNAGKLQTLHLLEKSWLTGHRFDHQRHTDAAR
jgi:hypothetical protein